MGYLKRPVLGLFVLGIIVQATVLVGMWVVQGDIGAWAFRSVDGREYYALASNWVEHGEFSRDSAPPYRPDTWRTPGYPLFLAGVMWLFGPSVRAIILAQQVLSVINVVLLAWICSRHFGVARTWWAGVLFLMEPYHHLYSFWILSATLLTTLVLLTWICWERAWKDSSRRWWGCMGLLSGSAILVWPVAVFVPPVLGLGAVIFLIRSHGLVRTLGRVVIFSLAAFMPVGSWMLRNYSTADHFAMSDQAGVVFAYFKTTEIVLWNRAETESRYVETRFDPSSPESPHRIWSEIDIALQQKFASCPPDQVRRLRWWNLAQGNKTDFDSFEISNALMEIGWFRLKEIPVSTVNCCLTRMFLNLTFPLELILKSHTGIEPNPLKNTVAGIIYLLLTFAVVVRLLRPPITTPAVWFPIMVTLALLLAVTPQLDPRFRVPMIPLLLFLALLPVGRLREA